VRGKGLLLAFELVADRETMRPLPRELNAYLELVELAYAEGLIIYSRRSREGREGDHFLVCPPMIATETHVEEIIDMLGRALDRFADAARSPTGELRLKAHVQDHHLLRHHRVDPHPLHVAPSAGDGRADRRAIDRGGESRRRHPSSACARPDDGPAFGEAGAFHGFPAGDPARAATRS
jgi:hypothetical protein